MVSKFLRTVCDSTVFFFGLQGTALDIHKSNIYGYNIYSTRTAGHDVWHNPARALSMVGAMARGTYHKRGSAVLCCRENAESMGNGCARFLFSREMPT